MRYMRSASAKTLAEPGTTYTKQKNPSLIVIGKPSTKTNKRAKLARSLDRQ